MSTHTTVARLCARAGKLAAIGALLILQACGGGGGGDSSAIATPHIFDSFGRDVYGRGGFGRGSSGADGSAGDGAPIANAPVVISGLTGKPVETTTDDKGYYQADVTGLTAPLLVTVTKPGGTQYRYSFSTAALQPDKFVTINVSGLTTQIASDVATALGATAGASALTPALLNSNPAAVSTAVASSIANQKTQLATIMAAAGVDINTYNPIGTPFVADHTGYDNLLDNTVVTVPSTGPTTTAPLATFNPIIGAWTLSGSNAGVVLTFASDGHYTMGQAQVPGNAVALQVWPGLEYGTYAYNSSTGDLSSACPSVDTNGTAGLANHYGGFTDSGVPIGTCTVTPRNAVINGDTMTLKNLSDGNVNTLTRIADSTNPMVGSWTFTGGGNNTTLAIPGVVTFTSDGHYMVAMPSVSGSPSTTHSWPGLEYGTYTWNAATGVLSFACPQVDTNGTAGVHDSYTSFTDGLISNGHTPVGTAGGGQPVGTCQKATVTATVTTTGNTAKAVFSAGDVQNLTRVLYGNTASATPAVFNLSIKPSIRRSQDYFPGNPSRFQNGMAISIGNSSAGASAGSYDSVRVTGNGLPTTGLWYVRSAVASQFAITTVRSATPQPTATLALAMPCPDCSSFWMSRTKAVSGANASVLDANPTSAAQWPIAGDGAFDGVNGVRPSQGAVYTFEIYKNATLVATETRTLQSNLVPADQAVNLAWNDLGPNSLAAFDVTNTALNGVQNTLLVDWIQNPLAQQIDAIWVSQTNNASDNATPFLPTATSVIATPFTADGSITQFTGITGTPSYNTAPFGGFREIGFHYLMTDGSSKSAVYSYYP